MLDALAAAVEYIGCSMAPILHGSLPDDIYWHDVGLQVSVMKAGYKR